MKYERKGDCNNCGWCCQFEAVNQCTAAAEVKGANLDPSDLAFYQLRGGRSPDNGKTVRYLVHAFAPCAAHDVEGETCKIYENRPNICRTFPSNPDQIEGTPCSHWFEAEVDGQVIRRGGGQSPYPTEPEFLREEVDSERDPSVETL